MSDSKLKSFVERIEKLEEEQRAIGVDKRAVYDDAKDADYNTKALRKLIAERRQKDREAVTEAMDGYRVALGMVAREVRDGSLSLDDAADAYGFSRSAIHRASHCSEIASSGTAVKINSKATPASIIPHSDVWKEISAACGPLEIVLSEVQREMTAEDLGDPLWVIDKDRAKFKEKVRAIASSVKVQRVAEPAPPAPVEDKLEIPSFLRRERIDAQETT